MCTLFSDAVKLRNLLFTNIKNNVTTELDFTGATDITSRFVNVSLGELLAVIDPMEFDKYITINNNSLDDMDRSLINSAITGAIKFYKKGLI